MLAVMPHAMAIDALQTLLQSDAQQVPPAHARYCMCAGPEVMPSMAGC